MGHFYKVEQHAYIIRFGFSELICIIIIVYRNCMYSFSISSESFSLNLTYITSMRTCVKNISIHDLITITIHQCDDVEVLGAVSDTIEMEFFHYESVLKEKNWRETCSVFVFRYFLFISIRFFLIYPV